MTEAHVKERLLPYLEDDLPEDEARLIESHLSICQVCAEELAFLRRIRGFIERRSEVPSPGLWDGIDERIRAEKVLDLWGHFEWAGKRLVPFLAAAAVLLMAVLSGLNSDEPNVTLEDYLKAQLNLGELESVVLNGAELSRDDILLLTDSVAEPSSDSR